MEFMYTSPPGESSDGFVGRTLEVISEKAFIKFPQSMDTTLQFFLFKKVSVSKVTFDMIYIGIRDNKR